MDRFSHDGLIFDVTDTGPADGPVAILLHGFPEDRSCWEAVVPAITGTGRRVLAPDQRGYSPGARPAGRGAYRVDLLAGDVLALADEAGAEQFDLVGHDWGAVVAWYLAAEHPSRVRTVAALSVPHTRAFLGSLAHSRQALMSWYMLFFQLPWLPEQAFSAAGGRNAVRLLERSGLPGELARRYAARGAEPGAMTGPINWYRALPLSARRRIGSVTVPTLFVYGDGDTALSRVGADACGDWVSGPYTYEVVEGGGHWLPELHPERVSELLVTHMGAAA